MLEYLDIGMGHVVAYRLDGKISTTEMKDVLERFRHIIDRGEEIHVTRRSPAWATLRWRPWRRSSNFSWMRAYPTSAGWRWWRIKNGSPGWLTWRADSSRGLR